MSGKSVEWAIGKWVSVRVKVSGKSDEGGGLVSG